MKLNTLAPLALVALVGLAVGILADKTVTRDRPPPPAIASPKPAVSVRIFVVRALPKPKGSPGNLTFNLPEFDVSTTSKTCAAGPGTLTIVKGVVKYDIAKVKENTGVFVVEATLYSKTPVGGAYHYNYADYFLDFKTTATDPSYQGEGVTESPAYDDADAGTIVEACD